MSLIYIVKCDNGLCYYELKIEDLGSVGATLSANSWIENPDNKEQHFCKSCAEVKRLLPLGVSSSDICNCSPYRGYIEKCGVVDCLATC